MEDVETLSDIADIENAVDDLSDDETKEPRLILPNLKEGKKDKRKVSYTTNDKVEAIEFKLNALLIH